MNGKNLFIVISIVIISFFVSALLLKDNLLNSKNHLEASILNNEISICGDGFLDEKTETCDDGNFNDSDECPTTCQPATCGDGFLFEGVEECDDGNMISFDGCNENCKLE